jgi:uncharacterized membrane protein
MPIGSRVRDASGPIHPALAISCGRMVRMDLGRIVAFTDGVMAVAITLLVLNIDVPDLPSGRESELAEELVDLLPSLGAYALAFALVGRYWTIHHRLFENLEAFDGVLMTLNLVFLALIALVPFSAELIDKYREEPIAAAVFGATLGFAALVHWAMVRHVLRKEFVREHERLPSEPFGGAIALTLTVVFFLSVPAAFVSTLLAEALWLSTIVLRYPLHRVQRPPR